MCCQLFVFGSATNLKANSLLYVKFCKWIHRRCTGERQVTSKLSNRFSHSKCEGGFVKAVEYEVM